MAFHPAFPTDPRVFIYYIDRSMVGHLSRSPRRSTRTVRRRSTRPRNTTHVDDKDLDPERSTAQDNHNGGDIAFGSGWLPVSGHGRWRRRRRSAGERPTADHFAREDVAHPDRRAGRRVTHSRPTIRSPGMRSARPADRAVERRMPRDLCVGSAQSLALELRPRQTARCGLADVGQGDVRGGEHDPARRQLRLGLSRRRARLRDRRLSVEWFDRSCCRVRPLARRVDHGRLRLSRLAGVDVWSGDTCSPISRPDASGRGFRMRPILPRARRRNCCRRPSTSRRSARATTASCTSRTTSAARCTGSTSSAGGGGGTVPSTLSATGCVNPSNATQPASGLIPVSRSARRSGPTARPRSGGWRCLMQHHHLRRLQQRLGLPERHRV